MAGCDINIIVQRKTKNKDKNNKKTILGGKKYGSISGNSKGIKSKGRGA